MTLNERYILVGLVVGGGGGFCEGLLNERAWHIKGHYGPEPDWFYGLVAMLVFSVLGSTIGAISACIVNSLQDAKQKATHTEKIPQGDVWPPAPRA